MLLETLVCIYLFRLAFLFSLIKYSKLELLDMILLFNTLFPILFSIVAATIYIPTTWGSPFFSTSLPALGSCLFENNHSNRCKKRSRCVLIFISSIINDGEHLIMYMLSIMSLEKFLFSSAHFWIRLFSLVELYKFFMYFHY